VQAPDRTVRVFFLYRDSPFRREALRLEPGAAQRYSLFGLDELEDAGLGVDHNLDPSHRLQRPSRASAWACDRIVRLAGGYSGDFAGVLACRRALNRAGAVFSTDDAVGIPVALLHRARLVRTPVVYAAIGLPERLERLRSNAARRAYGSAYRRLHTIVAYGAGEADALRDWLGPGGPEVRHVPFGVDTGYFRPDPARRPEVDVVSVGMDPRRDFGLLLELARRSPRRSFRVVASRHHAGVLASAPANVEVELDVPFPAVRDRLRAGRVVVLPVHENSYSGATTTLLQALACARPVVVSKTAAIARGYHLEDGVNCRLVPPGDLETLERAVSALLGDEILAAALGLRARETVESHLSWRHYVDTIRELLAAAARSTVSA
jgi:glycosyltransferase involved in cell wall biosynthesis